MCVMYQDEEGMVLHNLIWLRCHMKIFEYLESWVNNIVKGTSEGEMLVLVKKKGGFHKILKNCGSNSWDFNKTKEKLV